MRRAARAIVVYHQNILLMKRNKFGLEYYCLPGGGIDPGETADQAVLREVKEEASLTVINPRLAYIEEPVDPYGTQYHFVCDYQDGDVKISPDSIEAKLNKEGQNTFQTMWVPVSKFAGLPFLSTALQKELLMAFSEGFPEEPKQIRSSAEISYNSNNKQEE
jgi:8-oxo-dGTP diphosphatase